MSSASLWKGSARLTGIGFRGSAAMEVVDAALEVLWLYKINFWLLFLEKYGNIFRWQILNKMPGWYQVASFAVTEISTEFSV